jgi:hypothetical protein
MRINKKRKGRQAVFPAGLIISSCFLVNIAYNRNLLNTEKLQAAGRPVIPQRPLREGCFPGLGKGASLA